MCLLICCPFIPSFRKRIISTFKQYVTNFNAVKVSWGKILIDYKRRGETLDNMCAAWFNNNDIKQVQKSEETQIILKCIFFSGFECLNYLCVKVNLNHSYITPFFDVNNCAAVFLEIKKNIYTQSMKLEIFLPCRISKIFDQTIE